MKHCKTVVFVFVHFASLVVCVNFDGGGWGATVIRGGGGCERGSYLCCRRYVISLLCMN